LPEQTFHTRDNNLLHHTKESHQNTALAQIKDKRYFEKYQSDPVDIYLIGVEFNSQD
jgi:hypothetical protein